MSIIETLPELSSSECHVYDYMIAHADEVVHMSIQSLAQASNVSTATIQRLAQKLGCQGFSELKYRLRSNALVDQSEFKGDSLNSILQIRYFFDTYVDSNEFNRAMNQAARLLSERKFAFFVGKGGSNVMGEYGSLFFTSSFRLSYRIEDIASYPIQYFPQELSQHTCIIVCSVSGNYADTLAYVKSYHTQGCKIIAITANEKSVLATIADVAITYPMSIIYEGEQNLTTQIPCLYIIEQLALRTRKLIEKQEHAL